MEDIRMVNSVNSNLKTEHTPSFAGIKLANNMVSLKCEPDTVSFSGSQKEKESSNTWKWIAGIGATALAGIGIYFALRKGNTSEAEKTGKKVAEEIKSTTRKDFAEAEKKENIDGKTVKPNLNGSDPKAKDGVIMGLTRLGGLEDKSAQLTRIAPDLKSSDPKVQIKAIRDIEELSGLENKTHVELISPLLNNPIPEVQIAAIRAIGSLKDIKNEAKNKALIDLISPHLNSPHPNVQIAAIDALAYYLGKNYLEKSGNNAHIVELISPYLNSPELEVKIKATSAIYHLTGNFTGKLP